MKELIDFYLTLRYVAPSTERLFLGREWGHKDVRGPYLEGLVGHIHVPNAVLSAKIPSTVAMVLSMSNRCPKLSTKVEISSGSNRIAKHVGRNTSSDFVFESLFSSSADGITFCVQVIELSACEQASDFLDVLAIDELTIERSR